MSKDSEPAEHCSSIKRNVKNKNKKAKRKEKEKKNRQEKKSCTSFK